MTLPTVSSRRQGAGLPNPPPRQPRPAPRRHRAALALASAAALLLAGCLIESQTLDTLPEGGTIARLDGTAAPEQPAAPIFQRLEARQYRASLRRIKIAYATWTTFLYKEPTPLLSEQQVELFGGVLAREVPSLKPDQRIRFRFREVQGDLPVDMQVYPDGERLAFLFTALAREEEPGGGRHSGNLNRATLVPQAGQTTTLTLDYIVLYEPVDPAAVARAETHQRKLDTIDDARGKSLISDEEAASLRQVTEGPPEISLAVFTALFRRLETLGTARREELVTEEEYQTRRQRLLADMAAGRPPPPLQGDAAARARRTRLELIEQAEAERLLTPEESARLQAIVGRSPGPPIEEVRKFLRKRATLQQARQQELLSEVEFRNRLAQLTAELAR